MTPINPNAEAVPDLACLVQTYIQTPSDSIRGDAQKYFVVREVDVLYGFQNEQLTPDGDVMDYILVGLWRRHSNDIRTAGLTVRFCHDFSGICLAQRGLYGEWYAPWSADAQIFSPSTLRPSVHHRATRLVDAFCEALELSCPLGADIHG